MRCLPNEAVAPLGTHVTNNMEKPPNIPHGLSQQQINQFLKIDIFSLPLMPHQVLNHNVSLSMKNLR